ncbi:uncharacterized protein LOC114971317 isoform X1 [Acropora millepora]|uniref:uncharacterized protein LOC114971317 isoform X1 n=1 Tax=Acropora millepora TaxID=45264 RepID=UPI001CF49640|nr:uncharacterized protein LOC114971317 isoform X1 [Acropora millepora]
MKFLFVVILLVCTNLLFSQKGNAITGPQGCGTASKSEPINIHVHCSAQEKGQKGEKGTPCDCGSPDKKKPSAHIEGNRGAVTYRGAIVIKDWSQSAPNSHLVGGMTYRDGKLTVPISGRYFIYAQIYYYNNNGRVYIRVNSKVVTMIYPMKSSNSEGSLYTGGVFTLKAGDVITMTTASWPTSITKVWMGNFHSFMGAFLI